jgi:hypothetical protein
MASCKFYIDQTKINKSESKAWDIVLPSDASIVTGIMIKAYNRSFYELTGGFTQSYYPIKEPRIDFYNLDKAGIFETLQEALIFGQNKSDGEFCFSRFAGMNELINAAFWFIEYKMHNPDYYQGYENVGNGFAQFYQNRRHQIVNYAYSRVTSIDTLSFPQRLRALVADILEACKGELNDGSFPTELGDVNHTLLASFLHSKGNIDAIGGYYGLINGVVEVYNMNAHPELVQYQSAFDQCVLRKDNQAEKEFQITEGVKQWLYLFPEFLIKNVTAYYNVETFDLGNIKYFIHKFIRKDIVDYLKLEIGRLEQAFYHSPYNLGDRILREIANINGQSGNYIPPKVTYEQYIVGNISILTEAGYEILLRDFPVQINDNKVGVRTDLIKVNMPVFVGSQARAVFKNNESFDDGFTIDIYFQYKK